MKKLITQFTETRSKLLEYALYLFYIFAIMGSLFQLKISFIVLTPYRLVILLVPLLFFLRIFFSLTAQKPLIVLGSLLENNFVFLPMVYLLWSVLCVVSFVWSMDIKQWFILTSYLLTGVLFVIFSCLYCNSETHLRSAINILAIGTGAELLIVYSQYVSGIYLTGLRGNMNDVAFGLCLASFFIIIAARNYGPKHLVFLYCVILLFSICFVFIIGSRAAMIGLIMGWGMYVFLYILKHPPKKKVLIPFAILFLIVLFLLPSLNLRGLDRLLSVFSSGDVKRMAAIETGISITKLLPFTGMSPGSNVHYSNLFMNLAVNARVTDFHNFWIELIAVNGIPFTLIYVISYLITMLYLLRTYFTCTKPFIENGCQAVFCAMVSFVFASIGPSSLYSREWFWIFVAFSISFTLYTYRETTQNRLTPILDGCYSDTKCGKIF